MFCESNLQRVTIMMRFFSALACVSLSTMFVSAAEPTPEVKYGLKVGDVAPDFKLKDQNGKEQSLSEMKKNGPVAIVFFRSAAWCPYCQKQLIQFQKELKAIETAGVQLVGISYDSVEALKTFSDKNNITFPLLSDSGSKTIVAYAIKNAEMAGKKYGTRDLDGIPYPGMYLIDGSGKIGAKLFQEGYKVRHTTDDIVKAAKNLKK